MFKAAFVNLSNDITDLVATLDLIKEVIPNYCPMYNER
jgi:hypothetical protein